MVDYLLKDYDMFYGELHRLLSNFQKRFGRFVIFDIHSYCHRRSGLDGPEADPELNPEVNVGTGTMNRELWAPIIDRFISDMQSFNNEGSKLDVRENIKFQRRIFSKIYSRKFSKISLCSVG